MVHWKADLQLLLKTGKMVVDGVDLLDLGGLLSDDNANGRQDVRASSQC